MKVQKKGNDYSGRAVEKKTPRKSVLRAIIIFAVYDKCAIWIPSSRVRRCVMLLVPR